MKPIRLAAAALFGLLVVLTPVHAVVYGEDDRVDRHDAPPAIAQLAIGSSVALMPSGNIDDSNPDDIQFLAPALQEYFDLCDDQRFLDQQTSGWCSGTLIDDDLFLTAGHCIESQSECDDTSFVFNYHMIAEGVLNTITIDDIYACESVVAHEYTPVGDFAIVQVDRSVVGVDPPLWRRGGLHEYSCAPVDCPLVVIGHPTGLPTKIADNAWVQESDNNYFTLNADTFGGNSGSGVWNSDTLEGTGILVRGIEPDLVYDSDRSCWVVEECPDTGCDPPADPFEQVMRSNLFAHWLPERCGDHLCDPGEDEYICPEDCPQDSDYDLYPDAIDNCPWMPNILQENSDDDDFGDACDCDPADPTLWNRPGEIGNLRLSYDQASGWTQLMWDPPWEPGALEVVYDTLRSEIPFDFAAAACVESDDGLDLMSEDGDPILPGQTYFYLVRAQNFCPEGEGSLGADSRLQQRQGRPCP
jgi:V8-like Glu-specific endopeptidase